MTPAKSVKGTRRSNFMVLFVYNNNNKNSWASRFGITRFTQEAIVRAKYGKDADLSRATAIDKAMASITGGALSCWNQPIEVIRVEMVKYSF